MKRAVIVHCWDGNPDYCWYPAVKKDLEQSGFRVEVPEMPETDLPKLDKWLPKLVQTIGSADEELYLIGHSAGCITILRYLETLPDSAKIGGVVFVAGFTDDLGFEELQSFFKTPIDFEKIRKHSYRFAAINSDDDPYVPVRYGSIFVDKLGAELTIMHQMGHFSGPVDETKSITDLPEVVEVVTKMASSSPSPS